MSYLGITQDLSTAGSAPIQGIYRIVQTLTPSSVGANATSEQLFTVRGVQVGDSVDINKNSHQSGIGIVNVVVRAANQLAITFTNTTAGAIVPISESYIIGGFR